MAAGRVVVVACVSVIGAIGIGESAGKGSVFRVRGIWELGPSRVDARLELLHLGSESPDVSK